MDFKHIDKAGVYMAQGHGRSEQQLRDGLRSVLVAEGRPETHADLAVLAEAWYSDGGGFGHDCSAHQDVDKSLWSPHCGTFAAVTVAHVPAPIGVGRV